MVPNERPIRDRFRGVKRMVLISQQTDEQGGSDPIQSGQAS